MFFEQLLGELPLIVGLQLASSLSDRYIPSRYWKEFLSDRLVLFQDGDKLPVQVDILPADDVSSDYTRKPR